MKPKLNVGQDLNGNILIEKKAYMHQWESHFAYKVEHLLQNEDRSTHPVEDIGPNDGYGSSR